MFLKNVFIILFIALFLTVNSGLCQFSGFEDAPTRRGTASVHSGTLEGLFLEKMEGETPDAKEVTITFVISKLASAFFDHYDKEKKAIIVDLYDTRVGESQLDTINEHPIKGSKVEDTQVDLNKDIAGLRPDLRDVVRIYLYSDFAIPYEIEEEFGVVNLKFNWSKKIEKELVRSMRSLFWKIPLAIIVTGGAAAYAYYEWLYEKPKPDKDYVGDLGPPPDHPPPP
jgi:hypothetical protein